MVRVSESGKIYETKSSRFSPYNKSFILGTSQKIITFTSYEDEKYSYKEEVTEGVKRSSKDKSKHLTS